MSELLIAIALMCQANGNGWTKKTQYQVKCVSQIYSCVLESRSKSIVPKSLPLIISKCLKEYK